MANYSELKAAINAVVKQNGNQEITGEVLNSVLNSMVNSLGAEYLFAGIAIPSTNPGTPDQNVFYLASEAGTYVNFGNVELPCGISIITWNGTWTAQVLFCEVYDISAATAVDGVLTKYADLAAALGNNGVNVPEGLRKGGMSVKFIQGTEQSSDNNYVRYNLIADEFTADVTKWQGAKDKPIAGSIDYVTSDGIHKALKTTAENVRNKTISVEIGGLSNGVEIVTANRIRTSYVKSPLHIKVATGYIIKQVALFDFDDNAVSAVQLGVNQSEYVKTDDYGKIVRFTIARTDDANMTQSDLDGCISKFGYDGCDDNVKFLSEFNHYFMDIPFEITDGVGYNSSGAEVSNANFAKVDIDLTVYKMRKVNFLYGVSSTASCGFIVNGGFSIINYTESEKVPGTNYYNIIRDVPANAMALHISWAKSNLTTSQKVSANVLVKNAFDVISLNIDSLKQEQTELKNNLNDSKVDFSNFEFLNTLTILPYGINLDDGSIFQNTAYVHGVVDLTRNAVKTISFKYAYVNSAVATYGFIVNGIWQGVHLDVQDVNTVYDKTVIVPNGATKFICVWNGNVILVADRKVYGYGMQQFELVEKDIKESQNKTINIVKETNQLNLTFNLAKIPTIQAGGSFSDKTVSDFYAMYDALASAHSYYVTKIDCDVHAQDVLGITKPSQLDGLPIYMYKCIPSIGLNENSQSHEELVTQRPKILITSMHPQEGLGDFAVYNLFKTLCEAWSEDETIAALRSFADIYIIPFSWPWNYAHISRVNYNGVNPNRNFPTRDWAVSGLGTDNYTGPSPLSEYEAKVLDLYVQEINPDIVLDVHTSDQTSTGLMGIIIYNNSDTPLNKLVPIICRTTSNQAISDNNNYPQANPDRTLYKPYPDNYGGLKGEFFEYCYEAGITYSMLCEHSPYSRWDNGNFDLSWPIKESHTDGILRQQEQWAFNIIARCFREVASKYYCLY